MKKLLAAVALSVVAASAHAAGKGTTTTIEKPFDEVWTGSLAVVAEEFTLNGAQKESGVISFRSGTQDGSILVVKVDDASTNVTVNAKAARAGLSIGMGVDAKKIKAKFVKKLREKLGLPPVKE